MRLAVFYDEELTPGFNPRTPCGMRLVPGHHAGPLAQVSIHAPRVGCDRCRCFFSAGKIGFNPRTPCGMRRANCKYTDCLEWFQSTHPVWDATKEFRAKKLFRRVSIHAPRVGCDQVVPQRPNQGHSFNPRTPCGMRPGSRRKGNHYLLFQSTHPVWDATWFLFT